VTSLVIVVQPDRHTQTDADERIIPATLVGVSNDIKQVLININDGVDLVCSPGLCAEP